MTTAAVVFSKIKDSSEAGKTLGKQINDQLGGQKPNVVILFIASSYDYYEIIQNIKKITQAPIVVGSSSAGEFTNFNFGTDSISAVAIYSDEMEFNAIMASGISNSREKIASELYSGLKGMNKYDYIYHSAMIFADALSGYTDDLTMQLNELTGGTYQFFGGGAGDNENFKKTYVFLNDQIAHDSAVMLEILSNKPIGVGVSHGWHPVGEKMKVTESDGMRVKSLNSIPVVEVFKDHAFSNDQVFDENDPIPFFLHNVLGVYTENGYKVRVPLFTQPDKSIIFASDIPEGSYVNFMAIDNNSANEAANTAALSALSGLKDGKPNVAIFFDCVATRLRMGKDFDMELEQVKSTLKNTQYVGCNTYGQIARINGQFSGFHNCTAVVCIFPS